MSLADTSQHESTAGARCWDLRLQRERGNHLLALARAKCRTYFDEDGACIISRVERFDSDHRTKDPVPFHVRERIHSALALLTGDAREVEFAHRILDANALGPCGFTPVTLTKMLARVPDRLSAKQTARMREHLAAHLVEANCAYNSFFGANDNFPCMDSFVLIVAGELLGDMAAVQAGIDNLYSLRDMLSRRGFYSEYNSPTYAGVSLHALAEIVNLARSEEARGLARQAGERLWLDIAAHWHPRVGYQAGPYSRAYHNDSIGLASSLAGTVIWLAFGDSVAFQSPDAILFSDFSETRPGANANAMAVAFAAAYSTATFEVPDYIGELMTAKRYPYRARGTTEHGTFHEGDYRRTPEGAVYHVPGRSVDYGANSANLTTYLEEDFALGTASRGFMNGGQTDAFHLLYRLRPDVRGWADIRTLFTRYLVNETQPEDERSRGLLTEAGNIFTVQDDRRALVHYYPNGLRRQGIHSLRLALVLSELCSPVEEIWIGDRRLPEDNGESEVVDWVIIKDGPVLLAFYPLPQTNLGRRAAIRCSQENGYRVISLYNYQDAARDFPMYDLQIIQNGFVFEAAPVKEYPDVPAFLAELRQARLSDSTVLEDRRVRYVREGREMLLWMNPALQTVKTAAVNGREVACPPLAIDGIDLARVPWMDARGTWHDDIDWWLRICARPQIPPGLEGVGGTLVED
ncbi:MAG: hypothetical protein ACYC7E_11090 [Armatimonadota bacterium]